jgi:ribosomal protein S18 acetylase RimI-like enzyme
MNAKADWTPEPRQTLSPEEERAVVALRDRCNATDGLDLKLTLPTFAAQASSQQLEQPRAFLLYTGDALAGYCSLDGNWRSIELCGMVAPEQRRRGIGNALLVAALAVCKASDAQEALLICEEASPAGKALAAAHGGQMAFAEHRMELQDIAAMQRGLARGEPSLTLRRAYADESATLARIQTTVFNEEADFAARQADIEIEMPNPVVRFYLAELDGTPVGSLKLYIIEGRASIYAFGVLPAYRRRGLAWQTLALLTEQLRAEGITHIGLEVETNNTPAVALYQACGFRPITTYGYYKLPIR